MQIKIRKIILEFQSQHTSCVERFMGCLKNFWMLPHPQIIIGTKDFYGDGVIATSFSITGIAISITINIIVSRISTSRIIWLFQYLLPIIRITIRISGFGGNLRFGDGYISSKSIGFPQIWIWRRAKFRMREVTSL